MLVEEVPNVQTSSKWLLWVGPPWHISRPENGHSRTRTLPLHKQPRHPCAHLLHQRRNGTSGCLLLVFAPLHEQLRPYIQKVEGQPVPMAQKRTEKVFPAHMPVTYQEIHL